MNAAPLHRIVAFRLVTQQPATLARFYAEALGTSLEWIGPVTGEEGAGERTRLSIGAQELELEAFSAPGAPYPEDLAADDLRFQHCAFVVADIGDVHDRALARGAGSISRCGPVTLPPSSGGVAAVKLRDPEGHPFELLCFPKGTAWDRVRPNACGVLGIDHSAIAVRDVAASIAFYAGHELDVRGRGVNEGPTQAALDGLDTPVVEVVPLHPAKPEPHLELLGYHGRHRPVPPVGPRDVAATRVVWASDRDGLLIDPNGHRHQLVG